MHWGITAALISCRTIPANASKETPLPLTNSASRGGHVGTSSSSSLSNNGVYNMESVFHIWYLVLPFPSLPLFSHGFDGTPLGPSGIGRNEQPDATPSKKSRKLEPKEPWAKMANAWAKMATDQNPKTLAPSRHRCPHCQMVCSPCSCHFHRACSKLLCEYTSSHNNVDGFPPPRSGFLAYMPREPAAPSRTQPPLKEHGVDLATPATRYWPAFVAWRLPNTTVQNRDPAGKKCEEK